MKKYILIITCFFAAVALHAQSVSVSFHIVWNASDEVPLVACAGDSVPFLEVTYANLSDSALYIPSLGRSNAEDRYPSMAITSFISPTQTIDELVASYHHANKSEKTISVDVSELFCLHVDDLAEDWSWQINCIHSYLELKRAAMHPEAHSAECKGDSPSPTCACVCERACHNRSPKQGAANFNVGSFSQELVFLKPHSTVTCTFDLMGFWHVGGAYEFCMEQDASSPQTIMRFADAIHLPEQINGFSLYQGQFLTEEAQAFLYLRP